MKQSKLINYLYCKVKELENGGGGTGDPANYTIGFNEVTSTFNFLKDGVIIDSVDLSSLDDEINNTSELVNDGSDGLNPFISLQDFVNTLEFDTYSDALSALGVGKLFLYSQGNLDGVPSPNGSVFGITK